MMDGNMVLKFISQNLYLYLLKYIHVGIQCPWKVGVRGSGGMVSRGIFYDVKGCH